MGASKWFKVWCESCGHASEVLGKDTSMQHTNCPRRQLKKDPPQYRKVPPLEDFDAHRR